MKRTIAWASIVGLGLAGCPEAPTPQTQDGAGGQDTAAHDLGKDASQAETLAEVTQDATTADVAADVPAPQSTLGASDTATDDAAMAKIIALWDELAQPAPSPAAVETLWTGELAAWVATSDAYAGQGAHTEITWLLVEADVLDLEAVRGMLVLNLTQHIRKRLKDEVSNKYPDPTTPMATLLHEWDRGWAIAQALLPLAAVPDAQGDTLAADLEAAFHAGNLGIQANGHFEVGAARQTIEKTLFRMLDRLIVGAAGEALALANPKPAHFRAQARARAYLGSVADRLAGRNTHGLVVLDKMFSRPINAIDPVAVGKELQIAWARRTYKYTRHATDDTTLIGTEGGALSAVEGRTYYRIIAPGVVLALGSDTGASLATWDAWADAIRAGDLAGTQAAGAKLEAEVCSYQKALGLPECTHDQDTPASSSTLTACGTDEACGGGACLTPGVCAAADPECGRCAPTFPLEQRDGADQMRAVMAAIDAGDRATALATYEASVTTLIAAADATLGLEGDKSLDGQIKALLAEGTARAEHIAAKWVLRESALRMFKKLSTAVVGSVGGAGSIDERLASWDQVFSTFAYGWWDVGLAEDAGAIDVTLDGFDRVNLGIQDDDAWWAGAGRQQVEKTAYRILYLAVVHRAEAAKAEADAQKASDHAAEAMGALRLLGDRVSEKLSAEAYAALVAQLDGTTPPTSIDPVAVATGILQALAQRTFKYTKHTEGDSGGDPALYGVADGYLKAVEGAAYFGCIADALYIALGADSVVWDKLWERWQLAIATGDATRGAPTSDFLEAGVCSFEKALGIDPCK